MAPPNRGPIVSKPVREVHHSPLHYKISSQEPSSQQFEVINYERKFWGNSLPETRLETRSFPALAVTIVLWAPETQGPWSAHNMIHIWSMSYISDRTWHTSLLSESRVYGKTNGTKELAKSSENFKHNQSLQSWAIYLNKLCTVTWKAAFEPQKRNNIPNTITRFNNGRHWHTSIAWLLTYKAIKTNDMKP